MGEYRLKPGKRTPYDIDTRVPLIITGPGVVKGAIRDEIVQNIDLSPTFAQLTGGAARADADGRSLAVLLRGDKVDAWRSLALIEHHGPQTDPSDPDTPRKGAGNPPSYEALRSPRWLYVEYADGEKEFHDLSTDPDQLRNTYKSLPDDRKISLHRALKLLSRCRSAESCWAAGQPR
jgi:N-acetylglucosamine-6-sulfatase